MPCLGGVVFQEDLSHPHSHDLRSGVWNGRACGRRMSLKLGSFRASEEISLVFVSAFFLRSVGLLTANLSFFSSSFIYSSRFSFCNSPSPSFPLLFFSVSPPFFFFSLSFHLSLLFHVSAFPFPSHDMHIKPFSSQATALRLPRCPKPCGSPRVSLKPSRGS